MPAIYALVPPVPQTDSFMHRTPRCWLCCLISTALLWTLLGILPGAEDTMPHDYLLYIGTYTRGSDSQGIYRCRVDARTGALTDLQLASEATNPSFLAVRPDRRTLYAVSEIDQLAGQPTGGLAAYRIDPASGNLTLLNVEATGGTGPCYVTTDSRGRFALAANYGGGSVAAFPLLPDGRLGPGTFVQHTGKGVNPKRQAGPHAHSIVLNRDETRAYAADLGLDQIRIYRVDPATGVLTANDPAFAAVAPGSGPRHFDFHPTGRFAYVINEMSSTVTAFACDDATGGLTELQTLSTLPPGDYPGNSTADLHVHPTGRFLYGSNRGHNSIVVYAIDPDHGTLTFVQHQPTLGDTPRNFALDPAGRILLAENQQSGTIHSFLIDPQSGRLSPTGHHLEVPRPVCIQFVQQPL